MQSAMAQAKVNEFFASKKRHSEAHAAKRRKIELPFSHTETSRSLRSRSRSDEGKKSPATNPLIASDSETEMERDGVTAPTTMLPPSALGSSGAGPVSFSDINFSSAKTSDTIIAPKSVSLRKGQSIRLKAPGKTKSKSRSNSRSLKAGTGQTKLTDMLGCEGKSLSQAGSSSVSSTESVEERANQPAPSSKNKCFGLGKDELLDSTVTEQTIISEEVTSVLDDHEKTGGLCTPRKRIIDSDIILSEGPKARKHKVPVRKLNSSVQKSSNDIHPGTENHESVKKKLDLLPFSEPGPSKMKEDGVTESDKEVGAIMSSKSDLLALVAEVTASSEHVVSPLPLTPERPEETSPSPEPITPELQNFSLKLKALSKMNGQALKNRLKKSGKIKDVKEKLTGLEQAVKSKKDSVAIDNTQDDGAQKKTSESLPAHERFQHLIEEGVPQLSLPFSYKLLDGAFQAVDTVVSMMHNRSEMCTFSKLRSAVQNMTKKNFEEKTMGQIKTIVPDAYIFRQEKNIPTIGKKSNDYQLTVEANLKEDNKNTTREGHTTKDGKPTFTASVLIRRKQCFTKNLLDYVKQHHRTFLASLRHPLAVPDDQLMRWHPQFQLDKVPEVTPSKLPQPPEVKVYHSAKDVLEKQRGKLNPRVEEALAKIVAEKEAKDQNTDASSCPSPTPSSSSSSSSSSSQNVSSLKGIPPALLAKIRAKEAQKMEQALTRNPTEDTKTKMMSRLPDIIRILRSYFLTEKKPALLMESVYKKLEDSYSTGVSRRDVEQYVNLLKELTPEFVSVVEIKRGKYLKLDKNVDVQAMTSRIQNLVKSRK